MIDGTRNNDLAYHVYCTTSGINIFRTGNRDELFIPVPRSIAYLRYAMDEHE